MLIPEMRSCGIDAAGLRTMGVMSRLDAMAKQPAKKTEQFNKHHALEKPYINC